MTVSIGFLELLCTISCQDAVVLLINITIFINTFFTEELIIKKKGLSLKLHAN